jgi:hypothetical protein
MAGGWTRSGWRWWAVTTVAGLLAVLPTEATARAASCELVPRLTDSTVNQGLGSYDPLVRGKEALVRFFLAAPSCGPGDFIELTSASLEVSGGGAAFPLAPTPALGERYPILPPLWASPLPDEPGNPVFVVPGSVLDRIGSASFKVTLRGTFGYRATASDGRTSTGTVSFGHDGSIARTVAGPTEPARLLVVPMGIAGDPRSLPPQALGAIHNGMRNLSRLLPVRDGLGELDGGGSPGIRYSILPAFLDLGPAYLDLARLGPAGLEYCGGGFSSIAGVLAAYRNRWNDQNPGAPADRVVGVVWEGIAPGLDRGCEEGRAMINGNESWVRLSGDVLLGTPARTGSALGMELLHNLGGALGRHTSGYHSLNAAADGSSPGRAYHLAQRRWLPASRSVMNVAAPGWSDATTLYELGDWEQARCRLTAGATCPGVDSTGTSAAGEVVAVSGRSAPGGALDLHTYVASSAPVVETQPGSPYVVAQLDAAGQVLSQTPVPLRTGAEGHLHDGPGGHDHEHDGGAALGVAVAKHPATAGFQVRRDGAVVYERSATSPPTVLLATESPSPLGGGQALTVTAAAPRTDLLRLDVTLEGCGPVAPVLVGLRPTLFDPRLGLAAPTATWVATYDRSRACAAGRLVAHVTDGYSTTTAPMALVGPAPEPDPAYGVSAAIASPTDGATFLQYDAIRLLGTARDHDDRIVDEARLRWTVTRPDGSTEVLAQRGSSVELQPPVPGGTAAGRYGIVLDVLDAAGGAVLTSVAAAVDVVRDADRDGVPAPEPACLVDGDDDPRNAYSDPDRDGLVGGADSDPCTSASNVAVEFDPETLYVPSVGQYVTLYATGDPALLAAVDPATVAVTSLAGHAVHLPAQAWGVAGGTATVKIDKQALNRHLADLDLVGRYVPVVLTSAGAAAIRGLDLDHPITQRK